ncbi:NADPH-dependent FMN reductase [Rubritalea marina]|uniref:NADPH-dependent FMN reductase n=1 Tax=Rubritalea marina TaxID=361055 RepID=UPI0004758C32|nr:NADPH-dependent FMN reductase [Rubritalea marina]
MNILSIGASSSSKSINQQLANYAAGKIKNAVIQEAKIGDFPVPIFSTDLEETEGIPEQAQRFRELIQSCDAIVISLAEHNGSYTAAFKNLYDWASRIDYAVWCEKPMLLLATSPGARGGATVLEAAAATFPRMGAQLVGSLSVPSFHDNFQHGALKHSELDAQLNSLTQRLHKPTSI